MNTRPLVRPCTTTWLWMLALSFITYAVARAGLAGNILMALVLLIALFKGQLVVDRFMGLRHVSGFWRPLLTGYLLLTGAALAGAFFL